MHVHLVDMHTPLSVAEMLQDSSHHDAPPCLCAGAAAVLPVVASALASDTADSEPAEETALPEEQATTLASASLISDLSGCSIGNLGNLADGWRLFKLVHMQMLIAHPSKP